MRSEVRVLEAEIRRLEDLVTVVFDGRIVAAIRSRVTALRDEITAVLAGA